MAKVDIAAVEKQAALKEKEVLSTQIIEKVIGERKYFKGPFSEDWFDDYGECLSANEKTKRISDLKAKGLDEYGRSPEQVDLSKAKAKLLEAKAKLLEQVKKIDDDIRSLAIEQFAPKKEKKTK